MEDITILQAMYALKNKVAGFREELYSRKLNNSEMELIDFIVISGQNGKKVIASEIARNLNITRAAVSQIIKKLEKETLIKRIPSPVDKKKFYIELGEGSTKIYENEKERLEKLSKKITERMGEEDLRELIRLVKKFSYVLEFVNV